MQQNTNTKTPKRADRYWSENRKPETLNVLFLHSFYIYKDCKTFPISQVSLLATDRSRLAPDDRRQIKVNFSLIWFLEENFDLQSQTRFET
jgi:hypothetical protein